MSFFLSPKNILIACIVLHKLAVTTISEHFDVDDKVAFELQWGGNKILTEDLPENILSITTKDKEQYQCVIPNYSQFDLKRKNKLKGPNPMFLLKKLFLGVICVLKIEHFWTYELCHGRFIRQYHKDLTLEEKIYREYILGKSDPSEFKYDDENSKFETLEPQTLNKIIIDGIEYPYWGLNMTDGSACDITGQNRYAYVMYICHEQGMNEIHSIKETSSCEYEVVVLSPLLCAHPAYRHNSQMKSDINCYAMGDTPTKPSLLLSTDTLQTNPKEPEPNMKNEEKLYTILSKEPIYHQPKDNKLMEDFLTGKHCLQGGSGWWQYELCYGVEAFQFHEENGVRTQIILGKWDVVNHLLWLEENPHKKPKKGELKEISHMYTGGNYCDEIGKQRSVEVRLKCQDSKTNPNSISMYLLEPKPCEYILPVESPILCPIIEKADEFGL